MWSAHTDMDVRYRDSGDIKIMDLEGRIDEYGRTTIQEAFDALLAAGKNKIICNMTSVEYIGPGAMKVFVDNRSKAKQSGGEIKICGVQPAVMRMFEFAGLSDKSAFMDDWKQGVKELKQLQSVAPPTSSNEGGDFGQTIQMGGSPLASFGNDDEFGQTIQMGGSPLAALTNDDQFGQTIQMGGSPLTQTPVEDQEFRQTIQMTGSPLASGPSPKAPPVIDPTGMASKSIDESTVNDDDFMVENEGDDDFDMFADEPDVQSEVQGISISPDPEPAPAPILAPATPVSSPAPLSATEPAPALFLSEKIEDIEKIESSGAPGESFSFQINYRVKEKVADGKIGILHYGEECGAHNACRPVMLKHLKNEFVQSQEHMSLLAEEIRKVSLMTHQNLGETYNVVTSGSSCYLVMERIDGVNLATVIEKLKENERLFSPHLASLIIYRICRALEYARKKLDLNGMSMEMLHGEITPEKIVISRDMDVKLMNLGVSRAENLFYVKQNPDYFNNQSYTAPEVRETKTPCRSGDIFSVGVLFYELLTNKKPFTPEQITHNLPPALPPSRTNEKVNDILDGIVLRCLSGTPDRRFKDCEDIALQLDQSLAAMGFMNLQVSLKNFLERNNIL